MDRNIWLSASHIAGVENTEADFISRHKNSDLEQKLDTAVFDKIIETYVNATSIYLLLHTICNSDRMCSIPPI